MHQSVRRGLCRLAAYVVTAGSFLYADNAHSETPTFFAQAIIGGQEAAQDEGVYMLQVLAANGDEFLCTASALSHYVLITAAHCVSPAWVGQDAEIVVFVGSSVRDEAQVSDDTLFIPVQRRRIHPRFNASDLRDGHDIALLRTEVPLPHVVSYDFEPLPEALESVRVMGYGVTRPVDMSDQTSGVRRSVDLPVISQTESSILIGDDTRGACYGDSGAPVFWENRVIGVMSYGPKGCRDGMYAVLIAPHSEFIEPLIWRGEVDGGAAHDKRDEGPAGCFGSSSGESAIVALMSMMVFWMRRR